MSEVWDLVDKNGQPLGMKWLRENHASIPEGCYHPCAEVWVRVEDKVLLSQRHPNKSEGLKYDAPGGAVVSGESMMDSALRELYEEVGISAKSDELIYLGAITGRKGYAVSYLVILDKLPEIRLQPTEVIGYKLVTQSELENMIDQLCMECAKRYFIYKNQIF